VSIVLKSGSLNLLEPSGPVQACNGIALLLPLLQAFATSTHAKGLSDPDACNAVDHVADVVTELSTVGGIS
jgi:hypothetical protein